MRDFEGNCVLDVLSEAEFWPETHYFSTHYFSATHLRIQFVPHWKRTTSLLHI
jgi:hypothetical protein